MVDSSQIPDPARVSVNIESPAVTEHVRYTIVPTYADGEPPGGPRGSDGEYRVVFVLGVPGVESVVSRVDLNSLEASGDSLIVSHPLQIDLETTTGDDKSSWILHTNNDGRLSHAEILLYAENLQAAEKAAHDQVMSILSRVAFAANIGLVVKATYITEIATGTQSIAATFMGRMRPIGEITGSMNPELGSLLATYREGLSSITPLYQALSYYKVIEGIKTSHTKRTREAKRAGSELPANPLDGTLPTVADDVPNVYALETELVAQYGGKRSARWRSLSRTRYATP